MISVAIAGVTGYTGMELVRILLGHPQAKIVAVTSETFAGQRLGEALPSVANLVDLPLEPLNADRITKKAQIIFCCLPHQEAMGLIPDLLARHVRVIDLSADFRLDSPLVYQKWYTTHTAPDLLKTKVYGLPELYRDPIRKADFVANPGCYPTTIILGIAPLLKAGWISPEGIVCDSKSGVTGAGRKAALEILFSEVNEGVRAYSVPSHRHRPEAEQELSKLAGAPVKIAFTPHLVPMDRGILSTIYARPLYQKGADECRELYTDFYAKAPFVRLARPGSQPNTKQVRGTNFCDIGIAVDTHSGHLIITVALDNLVKGAAGQAVQNMNLMGGLDETMGLGQAALVP